MATGKRKFDHDINVTFGTVGCNGDSMRVGIKIARADLALADADAIFCDKQLELRLICDPNQERGQEKQLKLIKGNMLDVDALGISKSFSAYNDHFACSLSLPVGGKPDLLKFSKRPGKILVTVTGSAASEPEAAPAGDGA